MFGADRINRRVPRGAVQPAGQRWVADQCRRTSGDTGKDLLRNLLGQMCAAARASKRRRVYQAKVPTHQFTKGALVVPLKVAMEQIGIG